jgi:hypothetical protein
MATARSESTLPRLPPFQVIADSVPADPVIGSANPQSPFAVDVECRDLQTGAIELGYLNVCHRRWTAASLESPKESTVRPIADRVMRKMKAECCRPRPLTMN